MNTILHASLLIAVMVAFVFNSVTFTIHSAMMKSLLLRVEAAENKLRQILLPVELDELHAECPAADTYNRLVEIARENGEFDEDEEYHIPPIPNSRETNSNGIPIARRQMVGDEPPTE